MSAIPDAIFKPTPAYGDRLVPSWPEDFPQAVVMTDIERLRAAGAERCEMLDAKHRSGAYCIAKTQGNVEAAAKVVEAVLDPDPVIELGRRFPSAIVVAVHAIEAQGLNVLPAMYAQAVQDLAGLEYEPHLVQANVVGHTRGSQRQRLAQAVFFDGPVCAGKNYIVADDTLASGATVASMRHYIASHGGKVVAVTALASAASKYGWSDPRQVAIRSHIIARIASKLDRALVDAILIGHGIAPSIEHISEGQGLAILSYPDADAFRIAFTARDRRANQKEL